MKIESRSTSWGIELNVDVVTENIYNGNQEEIKETIDNLLNVSIDLIYKLKNNTGLTEDLASRLEYVINEIESV